MTRMTRLPETTDDAESIADTGERVHAWKRVATAAALGMVSVGAIVRQQAV
jgi:hypothetical protein